MFCCIFWYSVLTQSGSWSQVCTMLCYPFGQARSLSDHWLLIGSRHHFYSRHSTTSKGWLLTQRSLEWFAALFGNDTKFRDSRWHLSWPWYRLQTARIGAEFCIGLQLAGCWGAWNSSQWWYIHFHEQQHCPRQWFHWLQIKPVHMVDRSPWWGCLWLHTPS